MMESRAAAAVIDAYVLASAARADTPLMLVLTLPLTNSPSLKCDCRSGFDSTAATRTQTKPSEWLHGETQSL